MHAHFSPFTSLPTLDQRFLSAISSSAPFIFIAAKMISLTSITGEYEGSEKARKMLSCKSCNKKYDMSCLKAWAHDRVILSISNTPESTLENAILFKVLAISYSELAQLNNP
ncbi:hypothetical protein QVD17_17457 [Tagetes erecta]|uniref:Uncharacterized protein n=1 Tax=Tagetes erecta TaxID=13708 RepID=A0AAD8KW30_TARER|nr:hypothetical protein QVD17_17457 [Tagetes erecta]